MNQKGSNPSVSILRLSRKSKKIKCELKIIQITWSCHACGEKGAGSASKDRHDATHAIATISRGQGNQISIRESEQRHSHAVLAGLSIDWARKQKEAENAKKAFHKCMKDRKQDW